MTLLFAILVGALYAGGVYMILRRSIIKVLLGLALISNGANLLIFSSSRYARAAAPIVPEGEKVLPVGQSDPLVQALILTAIVISFGVLAFALALSQRVSETTGSDDLDQLDANGVDE